MSNHDLEKKLFKKNFSNLNFQFFKENFFSIFVRKNFKKIKIKNEFFYNQKLSHFWAHYNVFRLKSVDFVDIHGFRWKSILFVQNPRFSLSSTLFVENRRFSSKFYGFRRLSRKASIFDGFRGNQRKAWIFDEKRKISPKCSGTWDCMVT